MSVLNILFQNPDAEFTSIVGKSLTLENEDKKTDSSEFSLEDIEL